MPSRWSRTYAGHGCSSSRRRPANAARGFTLIEVVVAMAILLVVMIGVLSAISFAYTSSTDTEMRNIATNVASYTLEYLRSRTVTRGTVNGLYKVVNPTLSATGTFAWYDASSNPTGAMPSMIDVGNLPLQSDGYPCNYSSVYVGAHAVDGTNNPGDLDPTAIVAGSHGISFASKHAARTAYVGTSNNLIPAETYSTAQLAWATTLQGYVSVDNMADPGSTQNTTSEDGNLAQIHFSGSNTASGVYRTRLTDLVSAGAWTDLVVRYPGVYPSTQPVITSFTPQTGYLAKVYTTDAKRVDKTNQEYNPYYTTNLTADKARTQAYRGFRVLTQVIARSTAALDANNFRHVQYYDVTVTVLWMNGTHESNYQLVSQIVAY